MQPTVIFSFLETGALRYRCINLPFPLHQRPQYHSHDRYHQFYLCNGKIYPLQSSSVFRKKAKKLLHAPL
jgi:hypothetical protein